MISNTLDIDCIRGIFHDRSCKNISIVTSHYMISKKLHLTDVDINKLTSILSISWLEQAGKIEYIL